MGVALISGAAAGLTLFAIQHWTLQPMIEQAERYEALAAQPHPSDEPGWQPSGSFQRNLFTALAAMLNGIGLAAILFGVAAMTGLPLSSGQGMLWGLAGLTCFVLAPSLGLPPVPPGAAVAALRDRQLWWVAAVVATAAALWCLIRGRQWPVRVAGIVLALLPHIIGAPAAVQQNVVPDQLVRQFAIASVASQAVFWLVLGALGGFVHSRTLRGPNR
jgi:cobalt transporter subunit CbtA